MMTTRLEDKKKRTLEARKNSASSLRDISISVYTDKPGR